MSFYTRLIICLWIVCQARFAVAQPSQPCLPYEPAPVALSGKIERRIFPGPPEYESVEHGDEARPYWVLLLPAPICVDSPGDAPEHNLSMLQLVLSPEQYKHEKKWLNKTASVSGTLFHRVSAMHYTPVLIMVKSISKKEPISPKTSPSLNPK